MFAKTLAAFKQKTVGGVFRAQHGRFERVCELLFLEILISSLHKGQRIAAALLIQLFGQCVRFQIGIFGQQRVELNFLRREPVWQLVAQRRGECETAHALAAEHAHGIAALNHETAQFGHIGIVQCGNPPFVVLHQDFVTDLFVQCSLRIVGRIGQHLPFVAVIQPQHHHAPIQILRARHNAVGKCGREHRLVAQHQFADAAGLHAVGHARGGFGGMLRQTAKRRTAARHGDKQHHHRQQGQAEGRQAVPQCVAADHFIAQGQGTRHQNQAEQRPQASEQAFVKQNGAGQQKHHHHHHDLPIAAGASFVAFQQCQQQQERHAALQAENRPELLHDQQKHAQQQHAVLPRFQAAYAFIQQCNAQQHERAENHIHPHRQLPQ